MLASALLLGASVASLNLCTDELLLLLAKPQQIASVTHLSQQAEESPLWKQARKYPANDGTLLSVIGHRPRLVLTMGGRGHDRQHIASMLGIRTIELPYPQSLSDVMTSVRTVARAIGRDSAGDAVVARLQGIQQTAPRRQADTLYLSGGGLSVGSTGLAAEWMRLAGMRQRSIRGDRVTLEQLLTNPPAVLLRSDYRERQYSGQQRWLAHPLAKHARAGRTLATDGRLWTCMGPSLGTEILRLRKTIGS